MSIPPHQPGPHRFRRRRRRAGGFTLTEMLTTVAALIILMGLAVSLAREVRRRSADVVTRDLLALLDRMMAQYQIRHDGALPTAAAIPPLLDATGAPATTAPSVEAVAASAPSSAPTDASPPPADPVLLAKAARRNNQAVVALLQREAGGGFGDELIGKLPRSMYDDASLRDAWGSPIVFMAGMHPAVGMADDNRPFFFSAGPDGDYLTRADNLYSYEGRRGE
jgi:type II secretory pathway pseudopilin PulG